MPRTICLAILLGTLMVAMIGAAARAATYPMLESTFSLPNLTGNPFDYTQNDVRVIVQTPTGKSESVPAFVDGGTTWRVRFTPRTAGKYLVLRVERNGALATGAVPAPRQFTVSGKPEPGFVRVSASSPTRFEFENGAPYFPLGNDVAWRAGPNADVTDFFALMGAAGENWSRVWMCHWDGKNLDWPAPKEGEGYLNLQAARRWDEIVASAGKNGIRFQMTLQHHGQYSSMVDPNWNENPWNKRNGGFLASPEEFFINEHARALTRAKYRYIIARYGYSPSIMAWELFNEVEGTDAARNKHYPPIAAWHKEMAAFIRAQDPYHHLITTSSDLNIPGLYDAVDYLQPHSYSPDPMAAIAGIDPKAYGKPVFFGEMGPSSGGQSDPDFVRTILWASIMSKNSGAGQYWFWDQMTSQHLFPIYEGVVRFLQESGLEHHIDLKSVKPEVKTTEQGSFSFGPGGGWGNAAKTRFTIDNSGAVEGAGSMPSFFQGKNHREMFPILEFDVNYAAAGDFAVTVGTVARAGASLAILVDGKPSAERNFAAAGRDTNANTTLHAAVPAGPHRITLQNDGADWVSINRFTLKPYGSALHSLARVGKDYTAAWVYRSDAGAAPIMGRLLLSGLTMGHYDIVFWDTERGGTTGAGEASVGDDGNITLGIPPVGKSIALYMRKR